MCGIAGVLGSNDPNYSKQFIEKLHHRGPDSSGTWMSGEGEYPAQFCHTRLAIIDKDSRSDQPFISNNGRFIFIFNGEIYNYIELRDYLEAKGYKFNTSSDSEVFFAGLCLEGESFQLKCNGMWSFCLWDRKETSALLGRDRFGVKPLFYSHLGKSKFAFASEMKALIPLQDQLKISKHGLEHCSKVFNYESTSSCMIEGIKRLPAGHFIRFSEGKIDISRWWESLDHINPLTNSYEKQVEEWKELFFDSVEIRMRSDVPIGSALSGGLDSSSVMAVMSDIAKRNTGVFISENWQNALCCSYPNSSIDEARWAEIAASSSGSSLSLLQIDPLKSNWSLKTAMIQVEDPYLTIPLPMLETYRSIKSQGISVTLDGHGADELFCGYGHINRALSCKISQSERKEIIAIAQSTDTGIYSSKERQRLKSLLRQRIFLLLEGVKPNLRKMFIKIKKTFNSDAFFELEASRQEMYKHNSYKEMDVFSQCLYEIFHLTILPTLLRNYDRYSMASGLEIRMPFMDWRLVCYSFSLPWRSKLGGTYTKRILRDAMKGVLIDDIRLRRDKVGWNAPVHQWLAGPLKNEIDFLINDNNYPGANRTRKAWKNFLLLKDPSYIEGEKIWCTLLPIVWMRSLLE